MGKNARMFGVAYDNPNVVEPSKLRYDACVTKDDDVTLEEGINDLAIGGGKYAVFMHKGAYEALSETYKAIYGELMSAKITLRDAPPFEEYLNRDPRRTKPENLKTRIYIPIA
jgi:AraC family transcriptional regulator